jgi:mannosyltransferase
MPSFVRALSLKLDPGKLEPYLIIAILILGSFLRFYNLGEKSLWSDEIASVRDSQSLGTALNAGHPPLFFIVLNIFRYFGNEEFLLRLPSAIFGILTILLIYEIGKSFFGSKEGLIAAFLLSISLFHIDYSQQARMYTIFAFFSMLSLIFLYKFLKDKKRKFLLGFIVSTVLSLYTHYFAIIVVLAEIVISIVFLITQKLKSKETPLLTGNFYMLIVSFILIPLLYAPWISRRFQLITGSATTGVGVGGTLGVYFTGAPPEPIFYITLFSDFGVGGGIALAIFLFFFISGIITSVRDTKGIFLLLWIVLPIAAVTATTFLLSTPVIGMNYMRYIIFVLPIYLLLVAKGIVGVARVLGVLMRFIF